MSKINAVRFINLNYNNNTMRISDDTFQMSGRSTLTAERRRKVRAGTDDDSSFCA